MIRSTKTLFTIGRAAFLRTAPAHSCTRYCLKLFRSMASVEDPLAPLRAAVKEQVTTIPSYRKRGMLLCCIREIP